MMGDQIVTPLKGDWPLYRIVFDAEADESSRYSPQWRLGWFWRRFKQEGHEGPVTMGDCATKLDAAARIARDGILRTARHYRIKNEATVTYLTTTEAMVMTGVEEA